MSPKKKTPKLGREGSEPLLAETSTKDRACHRTLGSEGCVPSEGLIVWRNVPLSGFLLSGSGRRKPRSAGPDLGWASCHVPGLTTELSLLARCQRAILHLAQQGSSARGGRILVLWQPKGGREPAPVWAPAGCPKEKPADKAPLIKPLGPEGHWGTGKERAVNSLPCLVSMPPTGLLGTLAFLLVPWLVLSWCPTGALVGHQE